MPLRVHTLSFAYTPTAPVLSSVSHAFAPGAVTAVVGPNGAGKSTLLRLLLGTLRPTSGSATLGDRPIIDLPHRERAARIAYVAQRPAVAFAFSVRSVVAMGCYATGRAAPAAAIDRALARLELTARADDPVGVLSAGQQQRVALARAVAQLDDTTAKPARVLLADEPVAAMDPPHALAAMALLRELAARGVCVVVVLHDFTLVSRYADAVLLLAADGREITGGPTSEALTAPHLRRAFNLDFAPAPDPARPNGPKIWLPMPDTIAHAPVAPVPAP